MANGFTVSGKRHKAVKTAMPLSPFLAPYAALLGGLDYENQDIVSSRRGYASAFQLVSAIYRAIQLRADAVNRVKFSIKTYDDEGEEITLAESDNRRAAHPFLNAVRRHRQYYGQSLLKLMVYSIDIYGETFLEKQLNDYNYPAGLRWLNPLGMTVLRGQEGISGYSWSMPNEGHTNFDPDEIAYKIEFNPFDDLRGQSKVQTTIDTLNIDRNLRRFLRDFFRNNARPSTIVSPDATSGGMAATFNKEHMTMIRDQINAFIKGAGNQYSTLVLPIPSNVSALEQPDLKGFYDIHDPLIKELFGVFGVPLSMAGYTADVTTYKDGDEILRAFYLNTIYPLVLDIQEFLNTQVLSFFDPSLTIWIEFDTSDFDRVTDADLANSQLVFGALTNTMITIGQANQEVGYTTYDKALDDYYVVQGVPVPKSELPNYWKYRMIVAPSVYNSQEITGEPLPQPVDPTQVVPSGNPSAPTGEPLDDNAEVSAELDPTTGKMVYVPVTVSDTRKSEPVNADRQMKEYRSWREVKMKNHTRKFTNEFLPEELTLAVNADLATIGDDKARMAELFDCVKMALTDGDASTPLHIKYEAYKAERITPDVFAEVMSRFEDLGLTELLDTLPDTEKGKA